MGGILSAFSRGVRRLYSPFFIIGTIFALVFGVVAFALTRSRPPQPLTISYGALVGAIQKGGLDSIQVRPGTEVRGSGSAWAPRPGSSSSTPIPAR